MRDRERSRSRGAVDRAPRAEPAWRRTHGSLPSQPSRTASIASSVRLRTPYRPNRRRRWLSTVLMLIPSPTAISSFEAPRARSRIAPISRALGRRGASRSARSVTAGKRSRRGPTARTASTIASTGLAFDR